MQCDQISQNFTPLSTILKVLGKFLRVLFSIWENINLTVAKFVQVFIVVDSHMTEKLAIW